MSRSPQKVCSSPRAKRTVPAAVPKFRVMSMSVIVVPIPLTAKVIGYTPALFTLELPPVPVPGIRTLVRLSKLVCAMTPAVSAAKSKASARFIGSPPRRSPSV